MISIYRRIRGKASFPIASGKAEDYPSICKGEERDVSK
jgi:hypothetical protein